MRVLRQHPVFAVSVILSVAIGVSVSASLLAIVESVRRGPVPFANADRVEHLYSPGFDGRKDWSVPGGVVDAVRGLSGVVTDVGAYESRSARLTGAEQTRGVGVMRTTPNLPGIVGLRMALGRAYTDANVNGQPMLLLPYDVWVALGADSSIVGRAVTVSGVSYMVSGVIAKNAEFFNQRIDRKAVWTSDLRRPTAGADSPSVSVMVLLRAGANRAQAREALGAVTTNAAPPGRRPAVASTSFRAFLAEPIEKPLYGVGFVAVIIAVIAAVNFTGLLLARGLRRRAELGLRAALGSSTRQLAQHIVGESVALCAVGGALGALLAPAIVNGFFVSVPRFLPPWLYVSVGWTTVLGSVALAIVLGVMFSLSPALELARPALGAFVRPGLAAASQSRGAARSRAGVVAVQVALATGLVIIVVTIAGGRMVLASAKSGFADDQIVWGVGEFRKGADNAADVSSLVAALRASPGVISAAAVSEDSEGIAVIAPGATRANDLGSVTRIETTDGFFATTGMRLSSGRFPTADEWASRARVVVITRALAERLGTSPLGARIRFDRNDEPRAVVGVIDDIRWRPTDVSPTRAVIMPMRQTTLAEPVRVWTRVPSVSAASIRTLSAGLASRGSTIEYLNMFPFTSVHAEELAMTRSVSRLAATLVGVALLLAGLGLYGMNAYETEARARELAIRTALGATRRRITTIVVRGAIVQAAIGVTAGAALAYVPIMLFVGPDLPKYMGRLAYAALYAALFVAGTVLLSAVGPVRTLWRRDLSAVMRA
jgi:putative ABC transport system permease protein